MELCALTQLATLAPRSWRHSLSVEIYLQVTKPRTRIWYKIENQNRNQIKDCEKKEHMGLKIIRLNPVAEKGTSYFARSRSSQRNLGGKRSSTIRDARMLQAGWSCSCKPGHCRFACCFGMKLHPHSGSESEHLPIRFQ